MDGLRKARAVLDHYEERWRGRVEAMHGLLTEDTFLPQQHEPTVDISVDADDQESRA